jgi:hypothetical protein
LNPQKYRFGLCCCGMRHSLPRTLLQRSDIFPGSTQWKSYLLKAFCKVDPTKPNLP